MIDGNYLIARFMMVWLVIFAKSSKKNIVSFYRFFCIDFSCIRGKLFIC